MESMAIDFEEENKFKRVLSIKMAKEAAQAVLRKKKAQD